MPKPIPEDTWGHVFYPPRNYRFLENADRFDFEPNATAFSWKNAWWLAECALLAYVKDWAAAREILTANRFDGVQPIGAGASKSTKGFLASRTGAAPFAVVAYRGTDKDDPRNAATDADVLPLDRDGYTVHRGFALALDQVWDDEVRPLLKDFLAAHPGAPVYFTGHSLGAALATLSVARFEGGPCPLYTVGSPRAGDGRFVRRVQEKTSCIFRFVNCQDIVTQVPPVYGHVAMEKYIDRTGAFHDQPSEFFKTFDMIQGAIAHGTNGVVEAIGDVAQYWNRALRTGPWVDPPPFTVGNHTPSRYSIRIWNHYSGM